MSYAVYSVEQAHEEGKGGANRAPRLSLVAVIDAPCRGVVLFDEVLDVDAGSVQRQAEGVVEGVVDLL